MASRTTAHERAVYSELWDAELGMLKANPDMLVRPYGAFDDAMRVSECSPRELETVCDRNVSEAMERASR